jgi:hypothetical protein
MKRHQRINVILRSAVLGCAVALFAIAAGAAEEHAKPDGTVEFHGGSVAVGVGYSWGEGTLTYKGKKHKFKVDGLSAGEVGARTITASGEVYHLTKLEDFNGNYAAAGASGTVAGGGGVAIMKNQNGVEMRAKSTTQGVDLKLGVDGVKVKLVE